MLLIVKMVCTTVKHCITNEESLSIVIYEALCFDVAQGRMNGVPNETRTHSCRCASLAC